MPQAFRGNFVRRAALLLPQAAATSFSPGALHQLRRHFEEGAAGQFDRRVDYPRYHSFKVVNPGKHLKVRVLVDHSMAELFINDGEYTMSEQFFPEKPLQAMKMEPLATSLKMWKLENIWSR